MLYHDSFQKHKAIWLLVKVRRQPEYTRERERERERRNEGRRSRKGMTKNDDKQATKQEG